MIPYRPVLAALVLLCAAGNAAASEPNIMGLRLGMSMVEGEIDAAYEGPLSAEIEDSVGLTIPYDHIETRLKDGSRLSLHLSPPDDGSRLFWIRRTTSWRWPVERQGPALGDLVADMESRFGKPSRSVGPTDGSGSLLLIFAMPGTESGLPDTVDIPPADVAGAQFLSYQQRVELLGPTFKGAMVTIVVDRESVAAVVEELVDHRLAATVLNPGL